MAINVCNICNGEAESNCLREIIGSDNMQNMWRRAILEILCGISGAVVTPPTYTVSDGRKVVTTAGTRVALAASTVCKKVDIGALSTNTGIIVVGGITCVAAAGTRRGFALSAGDKYLIEIDNLSKLYLDSTVNGEGVSFTYYT